MTDEPLYVYAALTAAELALVDYLAWRYQDVDLDGLPSDPLERWLWFVHGVADLRAHPVCSTGPRPDEQPGARPGYALP